MNDAESTPLLIDANVIMRFLVGEPQAQFEAAKRFMQSVEAGEQTVLLEDVIVAEVAWATCSVYKRSREAIADALTDILDLPGVLNHDKATLRRALVLYGGRNFDFADALLAARALTRGNAVLSFDRDFDRVSGVMRREPA